MHPQVPRQPIKPVRQDITEMSRADHVIPTIPMGRESVARRHFYPPQALVMPVIVGMPIPAVPEAATVLQSIPRLEAEAILGQLEYPRIVRKGKYLETANVKFTIHRLPRGVRREVGGTGRSVSSKKIVARVNSKIPVASVNQLLMNIKNMNLCAPAAPYRQRAVALDTGMWPAVVVKADR